MKTHLATSLPLLLFFIPSFKATGLRKGNSSVQEENLKDKLEGLDLSKKTSLTFQELGITTEREALDVCDLILNIFQIPIKAALRVPIEYGCTCDVMPFALRLDFECGVEVCADDIAELIAPGTGDSFLGMLPIKNNFCFAPSYTGKATWGPSLESKLCSGTSDLVVDKDELARVSFGMISLDEDLAFEVPNMCVTTRNPPGNMLALESCKVEIDTGFLGEAGGGMVDCPCEICGDWGTDIQLDCPDLLNSFIPDPLQGFFEFTQQCIGLHTITTGIFGRDSEQQEPMIPFMSPFLTQVELVHPEH